MTPREPDPQDRVRAQGHLEALRAGGHIVYRHGKTFLVPGGEANERQVSRVAFRILLPLLDQGGDGGYRLKHGLRGPA